MGLIMEEIKHHKFNGVEIIVDQQDLRKEVREPGDIVGLSISAFAGIKSAGDLIEVGNWLVKQGQYIAKRYTSTGRVANPKTEK